MLDSPTTFSGRLLSASYYLGLSPLTGIFRRPSSDPLLGHHKAQAMSALFLLLLILLTACVYDTAETVLFVGFPGIAEHLTHYPWVAVCIDYLWLGVLLILGVMWVVLLALALQGSVWKVPFLKQLGERKWIIRTGSFLNALLLAAIPPVAICAAHATSLTRTCTDRGAVYFLYDQGVGVPRWAFALGLYRVSLQARQNWGGGSTVLDRLNRETLRVALAKAKVVFLATHGSDGYATTWYSPEILRIEPPDIGARDPRNDARFLLCRVLAPNGKWSSPENVSVNRDLRLAYIFACDGGARAAQWREHMAPAQVITYNRVSTVWDHAVWFAVTGPVQVSKLR